MATAGPAARNLTREEVIALLLERLNREYSNVTRDEVSAIVDGIGSVAGYYDSAAIHRAGEETLRLWANRDQVGLLCTLKMSQEDHLKTQKKMQEEHAQAQVQENTAEEGTPAQDFAMLKAIADASDYILSLTWSQQFLAAAGKDRAIRVYDSCKDFALMKTIADAASAVNCLAWSQQLLAAAGDDRTIRIYDISAQEWPLMKIAVVPSEVRSLNWCGQYLGVGLRSGQLRVLDSEVQCGTLEEARLWDLASKAEQKSVQYRSAVKEPSVSPVSPVKAPARA